MSYTFHRGDQFYAVPCKDDAEALACVDCNPGTTKVINEITGKTIFDIERDNSNPEDLQS